MNYTHEYVWCQASGWRLIAERGRELTQCVEGRNEVRVEKVPDRVHTKDPGSRYFALRAIVLHELGPGISDVRIYLGGVWILLLADAGHAFFFCEYVDQTE